MAAQGPSGGFSLFPNTSRPPSRNQATRPRASTPQHGEPSSTTDASPPHGRETPLRRNMSKKEGKQPVSNSRQSAMDGRLSQDQTEEPSIQRPPPVADIPQRSGTAFSEAQTLVRGSSIQSRSSIAKLPFPEDSSSSSPQEEPALRSIFPQYNPALPADRQNYYPTQTSPTHIPRAVISRPLYSPTETDNQSVHNQQTQHNQVRNPGRSPMSGGSARPNWPPRVQEPPAIPEATPTEELRGLWKVVNGWKASASEGRVYCLKMTGEKDAPIYTLSSTTQPFYNLRLDPTSASAYVTVSRHDPGRPCKGSPTPATGEGPSSKSDNKGWVEALTTTLEEESRKHPPNDGLVSLLYPTAAAKMALDRPGDMTTVMTAEKECARLVWDEDSGSHFLVHPALAMPFCVTIERNPTWSRTEYTLEHLESPQHLARLTRDGTGAGWLEVDTAIAAKIDSVYIVDVAITALMLVAHSDDKFAKVEVFEPPPTFLPPGGVGGSPRGSISGRSDSRASKILGRIGTEKKKKKRSRMEEFELDVESQTSDLAGKFDVKDKDKLPGTARGIIKVLSVTFKCFIWVITMVFKALASLVKCLTSEKL